MKPRGQRPNSQPQPLVAVGPSNELFASIQCGPTPTPKKAEQGSSSAGPAAQEAPLGGFGSGNRCKLVIAVDVALQDAAALREEAAQAQIGLQQLRLLGGISILGQGALKVLWPRVHDRALESVLRAGMLQEKQYTAAKMQMRRRRSHEIKH